MCRPQGLLKENFTANGEGEEPALFMAGGE